MGLRIAFAFIFVSVLIKLYALLSICSTVCISVEQSLLELSLLQFAFRIVVESTDQTRVAATADVLSLSPTERSG